MATIIAIPKERRADEARVAATPETAKKLKGLGLDVVVERDAGLGANYSDADYEAAGAKVAPDGVLRNADIVLKVRGPDDAEIAQLKRGAILVSLLAPATEREVDREARRGGRRGVCHGVSAAHLARAGYGRACRRRRTSRATRR